MKKSLPMKDIIDGKVIRKSMCQDEKLDSVRVFFSRHETVNSRFKNFKLMDTPFRHDISLHSYCFHAVSNIVQLDVSNEHPLFSV